jgi:hypothetical protein
MRLPCAKTADFLGFASKPASAMNLSEIACMRVLLAVASEANIADALEETKRRLPQNSAPLLI